MFFRRKGDEPRGLGRGIHPLPVCGVGRSGGTIFLEALSRHPEIVVYPRWPHEQRPAAYLAAARGRLRLRGEAPELATGAPESEYKNGRSPFSSRETTHEQDYAELVLARVDAAMRDGANALYAKLAASLAKPAARCFSEKVEPGQLRDYVELFPGARVLALVRDPRDAIVSTAEWFGRDVAHVRPTRERPAALDELLASRWTKAWLDLPVTIEWARKAGREPLVVKYEELMQEPEAVFARIQEFAGLTAADGPRLAAAAIREPPQREGHLTSESPSASIGRWRRELDAASRAALERVLGPSVAALGYA